MPLNIARQMKKDLYGIFARSFKGLAGHFLGTLHVLVTQLVLGL